MCGHKVSNIASYVYDQGEHGPPMFDNASPVLPFADPPDVIADSVGVAALRISVTS
jgi:hypothetical protein